jgi:cysteine desulfurase/selenocysteine lyase
MAFDLERARNDTPGCQNVLHFKNAGSSLMPKPVLDATIAHLQLEAQIGGYEAADRAHNAVEHVYDAAAALIACEALRKTVDEIERFCKTLEALV